MTEPIGPLVGDAMDQIRAIAERNARVAQPDTDAEQLQQDAKRLLASLENVVAQTCHRAGMHRREVLATPAAVPQAVLDALRAAGCDDRREALVQGRAVASFGLAGAVGTGKSMAMAAWHKAGLSARMREEIPRIGRRAIRPGFTWAHWPVVVDDLRRKSAREGGLDDAHGLLVRFKTSHALVLDDLGAERLKGSYAEDWVANQLDLLIDERHGSMLPTWYTSNLTRDEFIRRYGSRLYSRLCSESPMVEVPVARDMRFVKGGTT